MLRVRVLVVTASGAGHVNPLLPLATALVAQGDQVLVVSDAGNTGSVEREGLAFRPVGSGEMVWFERLRARTKGAPGDGLPRERISHYFIPRIFGEIATDDMIDDVLAAGREFGPDLVLFETYAFAGPLAAELLGVPGVNHLLGPMLPHEVLELVDDAVRPLWRSFDRDAPSYAGVYRDLTVAICPPSLDPLRPPTGDLIYLRPAGASEPPTPARARPLVYVTLGTSFGNMDVFRVVLEGLSEEPIDAVVTVGETHDPDALGPLPANVRAERFIPQAELLPSCAAVVHHGGSGTTLGSLAHGLPQLVLPQGADNFVNGALIERAGIGRVLGPGQLTPAAVRESVHSLLHDPHPTAAAQQAAREIASMPSAEDVAHILRDRIEEGLR
jgi:UDP:flavonoid glycosyltransferase YjiC (YdhE family)